MHPTTKRILSTIAIIIASVAFGVVLSADLGFMKTSNAQSSPFHATLSNAPVPTVTIPSFADVAARVMPAVVSITVDRSHQDQRPPQQAAALAVDPFDFFFPDPRGNGTAEQRRSRKNPGRR